MAYVSVLLAVQARAACAAFLTFSARVQSTAIQRHTRESRECIQVAAR
jgi:hypothetical protein